MLPVEHQETLAERNQSHVLHGSHAEVGYGHEVEFCEREGMIEVVRKPAQDEGRALERVACQVALAARRDEPYRWRELFYFAFYFSLYFSLYYIEFAHREGHEVGGKWLRWGEDVHLPVGLDAVLDLGTVAQRELTRRHAQRHREGRLELRLVEAGERLAGL